MSMLAHATHDECWWHECLLPGALVSVDVALAGIKQVRLCGLHVLLGRDLAHHPDVELQLWEHDDGPPVVLPARARP